MILGGGGFKSKKIKAWQEDANLTTNAELMKKISALIDKAIKDKDIKVTERGFTGEFIITDNYE